ncbi:MAG: transcriptional regulator [Phycisphaerae bacterium]|nr:transcriptional regulator [Phycisphaerae bacterium]
MPTPAQPDPVTLAQDRFIAAWGQMGSSWGISRTMAEVFALLYITGESMNTDEVMERLQISRGNASMSLRALQDWGIITRVHKRGDRKEYFEAERDVWATFKTIARERKKRELDPVLASLYEVRDLTGISPQAHPADPRLSSHNERMDAMLEFMSTMEQLASLLLSPEGAGLRQALALFQK